MPLAPRLLPADQAAAYLGVPMAELRRLRVGVVRLGRYVRYDRIALDAWLDDVAGLSVNSATSPQDDAEAALARFTARGGHAAGRA